LTERRSASTLRRLLKEAERDVAQLERRRTQLDDALAGASDHVELGRLGTELAEVNDALHQAEERWLELAAEAEG
jgi:predicted  nucleic acid-binding Zn-ribbon protein